MLSYKLATCLQNAAVPELWYKPGFTDSRKPCIHVLSLRMYRSFISHNPLLVYPHLQERKQSDEGFSFSISSDLSLRLQGQAVLADEAIAVKSLTGQSRVTEQHLPAPQLLHHLVPSKYLLCG